MPHCQLHFSRRAMPLFPTRRAAAIAVFLPLVAAQVDLDKVPKKPKSAPLNDDLPYIKCGVCNKMVAEVHKRVIELVDGAPSAREAKRRFEADSNQGELSSKVETLLENICDAELQGKNGAGTEGKWMAALDISKKGQALELVQKSQGYCRRECRTIAKACEDVTSRLSDHDDDLTEVLVAAVRAKTSVGMLAQRVCTKMAGFCKKGKTPLWPDGKPRKNEEFKLKPKKEDDMDKLLASLKGANGESYKTMSAGDMDLEEIGIGDRVDPIDELKEEL